MTELLDAAELTRLYDSLDKLDAEITNSERDPSDAIDVLLHGHRFAAVAARRLGDTAFIDRISAGLTSTDDFEMDTSASWTFSVVLRALIKAAPVGPAIEALAQSPSVDVRDTVAAALRSRGREARDVLMTLAADPSHGVRTTARAALGNDAPPPWVGVFSADPATMVDAATLESAAAALRSVLAWATAAPQREGALPPEIPSLPEALGVDLLARYWSGLDRGERWRRGPIVLAQLLAWPSGVARAWDGVHAARDYGVYHRSHEVLAELPAPIAAERALALVAHVVGVGHTRGVHFGVQWATATVAHGWPADGDPERLFAALTPVVESDADVGATVRGKLARGLVTAADPAIAERLLAAVLSGDRGTSGRVGTALDEIVTTLPLERRVAAAHATLGGEGWREAIAALIGWGAATPELRAAWLADPPRRAHLIERHVAAVAAELRAELLAGQLDLGGAENLLRHLEDDEAAWDALHALRDAAWDDGAAELPTASTCWPAGAWRPADHAHLERVLGWMERRGEEQPNKDGTSLARYLVLRLSQREDADAAIERLLALVPAEARGAARRQSERVRKYMRE